MIILSSYVCFVSDVQLAMEDAHEKADMCNMRVLNCFPPHLHIALTMPHEHKILHENRMPHEHRMSMNTGCPGVQIAVSRGHHDYGMHGRSVRLKVSAGVSVLTCRFE